jgi:hypothetical protein
MMEQTGTEAIHYARVQTDHAMTVTGTSDTRGT